MGDLTQGQGIALVNYISQILVELIKLANLIVLLTKALSCANRISSIFDVQSSMQEGSIDEIATLDEQPVLEFEHVGFHYTGAAEESLSDITFTVEQGETVGIIGGTGSGKTSLVNLIPRFYDATAGVVKYLGKPIEYYSSKRLRREIRVVPQKAVLFKGTIKSNLLWGNENATQEEMERALEASQSMEFVQRLDGYLDAPVAQGGKNFSGGERQRLTIARGLMGGPKILILDDSTSALDYATDAKLRQALRERMKETTTFIVSQRTSSIQSADKIIVLEDGHMAGIGTHEELLETCSVYQEIYESQYQKPEKEENHE